MSRNLLKASQVIQKNTEPRVVDSNALLAEKIGRLQFLVREDMIDAGEGFQEGFQDGLSAENVGGLFGETEGNVVHPETEAPAAPVYEGPSPEELIAQAKAEIAEMQKQAEEGLSYLKKQSKKEGYQAGYEEGKQQALGELEAEKKKLQQREQKLEQEYQDKIDALEPSFIETLTGIYEEIFAVDLKEYKPILIHLISNAIRNCDSSRNFLVHVSREDYPAVSAAKDEILGNLASPSVVLEIIEDISVRENECMIETSSGIFDCGLGTQLSELNRKLRLLSYENTKESV